MIEAGRSAIVHHLVKIAVGSCCLGCLGNVDGARLVQVCGELANLLVLYTATIAKQ